MDDGSTDESPAIAERIAAKDRRICAFRNERNLGLAPTMNRLVRLARGDFVAVQEQDDVSTPERFAREVALLESDSNIGLVSGVAEWLDDSNRVSAYFPGILQRGEAYPSSNRAMVAYLYVEQCKVVNAAAMFRRSLTNEMPGPFDAEAKMSIDWQFFLHIAHRYRIVGIPEVLVRMHRGRSHNHLTSRKDLQYDQARRCIALIYGAYKDNPSSPISYGLYRKAMAHQLMLEGRYFGRFKGVRRLMHALFYDPTNIKAWRSLGWLARRGYGKAAKRLRDFM